MSPSYTTTDMSYNKISFFAYNTYDLRKYFNIIDSIVQNVNEDDHKKIKLKGFIDIDETKIWIKNSHQLQAKNINEEEFGYLVFGKDK